MTTPQLVWMTCGYLVAFVAVVYLTRATSRRALGALAGGAVAGAFFSAMAVLGVAVGLWQAGAIPSTAGAMALFYVGAAISLSPIYPITWRVARRFGWRGVAVCLIAVAVIGPPRDYLIAAAYPEWIVFAPGPAPVLAVSGIYVGMVALGHVTMWFVGGPAKEDPLVQRSWVAT